MAIRCPVKGNFVSGAILDLSRVSGTCLKMETPKNLVNIFLSKVSFDELSWVFCNLPQKFFWIFVKSGFSSSSVGFHGIINQFFIWFGFREKVEYWG